MGFNVHQRPDKEPGKRRSVEGEGCDDEKHGPPKCLDASEDEVELRRQSASREEHDLADG